MLDRQRILLETTIKDLGEESDRLGYEAKRVSKLGSVKLMVTKSDALKWAVNDKQAELGAYVERKRLLLKQKSVMLRFTFLLFYWLFLFHRTFCDVNICEISGNSGIPGIFRNWVKIWLYFVKTFKWLCCHLKVVVGNNLGFLPKFGMPTAMGMLNLYSLTKLKTTFFFSS